MVAQHPHSLDTWQADGLKPSQRKVLFSCFKRKLTKVIKVAQLAGYVSEHSAYHHGEVSLCQTIVGMAQNYVGSNNINYLEPSGMFGTRLLGGKDAASPRYIFTKLAAITRALFHEHDDALLKYQEEDGQHIEPEWYLPVIPLALVNGSDGIGTGYSTFSPNYNPRDIIRNIRHLLAGEEPVRNTLSAVLLLRLSWLCAGAGVDGALVQRLRWRNHHEEPDHFPVSRPV